MNLETLDLAADELAQAREAVRRMAYYRWCEAGRPADDALRFWLAAEREWIGRCYVPARPLEAPSSHPAG